MELNRRQFMTIAAAIAGGCDQTSARSAATAPSSAPSDTAVHERHRRRADPAAFCPAVSDAFRSEGFSSFIGDKKVFVLSSVCTHKGARVHAAAADQSFYCKCHGSTFDKNGKVAKGQPRETFRDCVAQDDSTTSARAEMNCPSAKASNAKRIPRGLGSA